MHLLAAPIGLNVFQVIERKREKLEGAILALVGTEAKEWSAVSEKIVEVYKGAADLGYFVWGKNGRK